MIKIILQLFIAISCYATNINDISGMEGISNQNKASIEDDKVIYKDMLAYLENSKDPTQLMVLGSLYASGSTIKDSTGAIIKQDIFLAEKFLLESANMGNNKALTMLGGFILTNPKMHELDKNYTKAEKYLLKAYKNSDLSAGILLSSLYFSKEDYENGQATLMNCANRGNSDAQFAIALLFKDGMKNKKGQTVINKNIKIAESYLNKACSNDKKSDKIQKICSNKNLVTTTIK